jgi:acetyltransferase-like isoleucine patch superfamily enzyme
VGKGSGVATESILTKDVLQYSIVAGNPAKRMKNGK